MKTFKEKYFAENEDKPQAKTVEDILYQDEQIMESLTPDKRAFFWSQLLFKISSIIIWLIVDGLFIFALVYFKFYEDNPSLFIVLICFLVCHLFPVWNWLYRVITTLLNLRHENYYITNQRIIVKTGIKKTNFKSIFIDDIFDIQIRVNFIDKRFKVGDIIIQAHTSNFDLEGRQISTSVKNLVLFDQQYSYDKVKLIKELKTKLQNYHKKG